MGNLHYFSSLFLSIRTQLERRNIYSSSSFIFLLSTDTFAEPIDCPV